MYKILLADDEALEREVLVYLLRQYNEDIFEIIEAKNGIEAQELIQERMPDIILLDIQMPGLTGLEVLENVRKSGYRGRAIFLTAFDQFDFAVKALKLQAKDFIVKPVDEESFISVIDELVEEILEEKLYNETERKRKALLNTMEGTFAKKAVMGDIDEEIMTFFEIQGFSYEVTGNCICIKMMSDIENERETGKEIAKEIIEEIREYLTNIGYFVLANLQNNMAFIIYIDQLYKCGIKKNVEDLGEEKKERVSKICDREIAQYINKIMKEKKKTYKFGIGNGFEDLSSIEESYACAREQIGDIKEKSNQYKKIVKEEIVIPKELTTVKQYLEDNFANKITLESLANLVGFTKYYLSRIYKKYYNENIMDCLIRIRMEKAKEILTSGEHNIQKISEAVGYADSNYFTWSFKKYFGETPMKYWQKMQEEKIEILSSF